MKVWVCTKVYEEGGSSVPMVESRIAFTEGEACKALANLSGFEVGPGDGYSSDPFDFAQDLYEGDRSFHVEEVEVPVVMAKMTEAQEFIAQL